MVKQTRIIFDLHDVVAVRFKCNTCRKMVVQDIGDLSDLDQTCPLCRCPWSHSQTNGANYKLIKAIKSVLALEGSPVTVQFELEGKTTQDSD